MSSPVISVPEDATVQEATQVMADQDVSCVFVQGNEDYAGIFTTTDACQALTDLLQTRLKN